MMTHTPWTIFSAASLVALGALAGCAESAPADLGTSAISASPGSSPAAEQGAGSPSDVAFAQAMIQHHQQAVEMSNAALSPQTGASPQVVELAGKIKAAQGPEIEQMTQWLGQWGAPTAMPGSDASDEMAAMDHSGHDMGGISMEGMMTTQEMEELFASTGTEFDQRWLTMMIAHHEGAIAMAEQILALTSNPQVAELASAVISTQQAEILTMTQALDSASSS